MSPKTCPVCAASVTDPEIGRSRTYCSAHCQRVAHRRRKQQRPGSTDGERRGGRAARERKQAHIREAKSQPCADCRVQYPSCAMQLDHARGEKRFNLSDGARYSWVAIDEELAKCDVVCANCHAVRTGGTCQSAQPSEAQAR